MERKGDLYMSYKRPKAFHTPNTRSVAPTDRSSFDRDMAVGRLENGAVGKVISLYFGEGPR